MYRWAKILDRQRYYSREFLNQLVQKPLSLIMACTALMLMLFGLLQLTGGKLYVASLNFVDASTLVMVAVLILRGVTKLRARRDLQTVSIALVSTVSFLFSYEAIYKWSFYMVPWRMPAAELREILLQVGVASVVLSGFAQREFQVGRGSQTMLALFASSWLLWIAVGFPQLWDGQNVYEAVIDFQMTWGQIYTLNRVTKFVWLMFYYWLYV